MYFDSFWNIESSQKPSIKHGLSPTYLPFSRWHLSLSDLAPSRDSIQNTGSKDESFAPSLHHASPSDFKSTYDAVQLPVLILVIIWYWTCRHIMACSSMSLVKRLNSKPPSRLWRIFTEQALASVQLPDDLTS